jgi:hypothetical protein
VAVIVRHFRCLQEKEARQIAQGRSKWQKEKEREGEGAGRRIRQRPTRLTRLARPRVDAHIGVRPSSREIRLGEGTNQSSEPAGRWDRARGPCEADDVTGAEFRRLGKNNGEGRMQFRSWVRGKGELYSRKAAR